MYPAHEGQFSRILSLVFVLVIAFFIIVTKIELSKLKDGIDNLQVSKITTSPEPERIKNTLWNVFPHIRIWGPKVVYYWSCIIYDQCEERGLDWRVVCGDINAESDFNPKAISEMNAKGMLQILDSTSVALCRKLGISFIAGVTPCNDISSMLIGIQYLDDGIKREKDITNGLKSYYAGPGWRRNPNQRAIDDYANTVIGDANRLGEFYDRTYSPKKRFLLRLWN